MRGRGGVTAEEDVGGGVLTHTCAVQYRRRLNGQWPSRGIKAPILQVSHTFIIPVRIFF